MRSKNVTFVLIDMCVQRFTRGLLQGRPLGNREGAGGVKIVTTRAHVCAMPLLTVEKIE